MKLSEGFAVADALGVDPAQLSPVQSALGYRIESLMLRLRETDQHVAGAIHNRRRIVEALYAHALAAELQAGKTNFVVRGNGYEFIDILARWSNNNRNGIPYSAYQMEDGLALLDIQDDEQDPPSFDQSDDDDASNKEHIDHYNRLLSRKFPGLTFDQPDGAYQFTVDGIEEPTVRALASDGDPGFLDGLLFGGR